MGARPGRPIVHLCLAALFRETKQTGVRPVGIGETWRRLFAKILLKVTATEATMACQDDQLCAGLKEGINGAIHGVQAL